MRLGQQNRRPCPYFFCSAILTVYVTKRRYEDPDSAMVEMIPTHEIMNDNLRPETCPASLMAIPLEPEALNLLHSMERRHYHQLLEKARRDNAEPPRMPFLEPPPSGSQSMLPKPGSRRFGRTPATEADQEDWALGGRADEDVQADPVIHPVSPSSLGYPFRGRSGSMSVAGVRAHLNAANAEASGAAGSLIEARDPDLLAGIARLQDAIDKMSDAYAGLENAQNSVSAGNEDGSDELNGIWTEYSRIKDELMRTRATLQAAVEQAQRAVAIAERHSNETAGLIEATEAYAARL